MNNEITVNGHVFEISTHLKNSGVQVGISLKSVAKSVRAILLKEYEFKQLALKYTRHSKKRERMVKRITYLEKYLALLAK